MHHEKNEKFMEEDGKVFSDYDVDMTSGRTWFEGVRLHNNKGPALLPSTMKNLDNQTFKIMLLNNGQYFEKDGGAEFRAQVDEKSAAEYKFIAAKDEDTYYLQSVANPDEWVSFQTGGWYLREKREGQDGYNKVAIRFTYNSATDSYDVMHHEKDVKFIEESGKVFSLYDVSMSSGRTEF